MSEREKQFKAYESALRRMVGAQWVKDHPDDVRDWWKFGFSGGVFRAGYKAGKKDAQQ